MQKIILFRNITLRKIRCIFILIAISAILTTGCASLKNDKDKWLGKDKLYHFAAAGAVSAIVTSAVKSKGASNGRSAVAGVSVTLALGTGKETYDKKVKKTYFSLKDMAWNLIGALTGSLIVNAAE